ncbi:DNA polymerase IV [Microbaculum sp. FT89]|uniref:DNA polymerase IV n=1 Tax=Microbaculum sp. FT89 TaxID=3447298 RepID=UPI003F53592B
MSGLPTLCLDCSTRPPDGAARCPSCGGPRLVRHAELFDLSVAHVDCDAFYAAIEKRDDPSLADRPLIIGGGKRGVVSTACYIARIDGVRSAMPMFKALKLCPNAVVIKPNMEKYSAVGRQVRALMLELTPLVEPLSIDEAFLDMTGTQAAHRMAPASTLVRFARRVESEIGITISVGLSHNKFLAKIASDLKKPRGFSVIGKAETLDFLRDKPVGLIFGVGAAMQTKLARDGITRIGDLQRIPETDMARRYGATGLRLAQLARGEDDRRVSPDRPAKSVSSETTFEDDISDPARLRTILWDLSETVSRRLKTAQLSGRTVTLKLKTAGFRTLTRSHTLSSPTQLADRIFESGQRLLADAADGTAFRLIGIGVSEFGPEDADALTDLIDTGPARRAAAERAVDAVRDKFGRDAVKRGIAFSGDAPRDRSK